MDDKSPEWLKQFLGLLTDLNRLLQDLDASYVLVGGVAVSLLAEPRATQDVDGVVTLDGEGLRKIFAICSDYNFKPRISQALEFASQRHMILLSHTKTGITLDLSLCLLPFQQEMIERHQLLDFGGLKICFPTPEDLIITKAVAHRPIDLADIGRVLEFHPKLDFGRIRYWVKEFATILEMPEILEDIEKMLLQKIPQNK